MVAAEPKLDTFVARVEAFAGTKLPVTKVGAQAGPPAALVVRSTLQAAAGGSGKAAAADRASRGGSSAFVRPGLDKPARLATSSGSHPGP